MSCKVMYTCDHCGKEVSPYINRQWKAGFLTVGPSIDDIHACSKEHLTLALTKAFDIPVDASTLRLVTEKNEALNAARAAIVERDNMCARVAELEARMPANEVVNAERVQYETTIELQRKRIEELEKRIAGPAAPINAADNTLPSLDDLAKKLVPIFEAAYHTGPNDQLASVRAGIRAILKTLPMPITHPITVDGKTPGEVYTEAFRVALDARTAILHGHDKNMGQAKQWRDMSPDRQAASNEAALAVLLAFGQPSKPPQDAAEALRKVRVEFVRFAADARMPGPLGTQCTINEILAITLNIIDAQLAKVDPEPEERRSDHAHEPQAITLPTKPTKPLHDVIEEPAIECDECGQTGGSHALWCGT